MTTVRSVLAVVRDLVLLTIVQPVREGRLRPRGWPAGLAAIVSCALAGYAVLTLAVVLAGPLREWDVLLVTLDGTSIPEVGVVLCTAASVLALALIQTAALHLPWWVRLAVVSATMVAVLFFVFAVAADPLSLVPAALGLLVVIVMVLVRRRSAFAWWEFVVVALALGTAVFVPVLTSQTLRSLGADTRALGLAGAMQTMTSLGIPALLVAGAALAQIAVSASFAGVTASARELRPAPRRVLVAVVLGWAAVALVGTVGDPENTGAGWASSAVQLIAIGVVWLGVLWWSKRTPGLDDLGDDSTRLNLLVAVAATAFVIVNPILTVLAEVARAAGIDWLFTALDAYHVVTRSDWFVSMVRSLIGAVGLVATLPLARRGRPWAALFLGALMVLSLFDLARGTAVPSLAGETVAQLASLLMVVLLIVGAAQLASRRVTTAGGLALVAGLVLCLVYPHRAILDDPICALLGFSGIAAVLFGLIWRVLTEGDITQEGTPKWPVPARVLLFCASALFGVTSTAYTALSRGSGPASLDITVYAEGGDWLLGTPLFLTAVIGCLAIAVAPGPPAQASEAPSESDGPRRAQSAH